MYKQSYSDKWNSHFPNCFKGEGYSQYKGDLIEDIRHLEGQISRLEKELEQEKNNCTESQQRIITLETQLVNITQELNNNTLRKKLIEQLAKRIAENKEWFNESVRQFEKELWKDDYWKAKIANFKAILRTHKWINEKGENEFAQNELNLHLKEFQFQHKDDEVKLLLKQQKKIIELEQQLAELTIKQEMKTEVETNLK